MNSAPVPEKKKRTRSWDVIEYHLYPRTSERNNIDLPNLSNLPNLSTTVLKKLQTNENP